MIVRRGHVAVAVAGAAAAAALALALRPASLPASGATVDSGLVQVTVDWIGRTRVRDRYQVTAPVTGHLRRVVLRAGDPVRAGEVVARIAGAHSPPLDPRSRAEAAARLDAALAAEAEASAALQRASSAVGQARRDASRAEVVSREGGLSAQALETARADADLREGERRMAAASAEQAAAEVSAARAALRTGGEASAEVAVRSPASGAVLRVLRESAGPVAVGAPILEVGDPSRLEVVLDLPTADSVQVRPGQRVVAAAGPGPPSLQAVVRRVEPSAYTKVSPLGVEEQRVDVILDPVGDGWERLADGYSVDAKVVVESLDRAIRVPSGALFRSGEGWAVYAVEDGRARRRPVVVEALGASLAAIRTGVRPGDVVLVHPGQDIADGVRVDAR